MDITLTPAAVAYIKKMLDKEGARGLRLSVKKTGCSGYSYFPSAINEPNNSDIYLIQQDIPLFIDPAWQDLFAKMTIDFVEEDKQGLKQKRLVFINANEGERCGCGESFHLAN